MEMTVKTRGTRKIRKGIVVSRMGDKSIVVQGERRKPHPLFGKVMRLSKNYHAHDEQNIANVGDVVTIVECRPISKLKHWRLVRVNVAKGAKQI